MIDPCVQTGTNVLNSDAHFPALGYADRCTEIIHRSCLTGHFRHWVRLLGQSPVHGLPTPNTLAVAWLLSCIASWWLAGGGKEVRIHDCNYQISSIIAWSMNKQLLRLHDCYSWNRLAIFETTPVGIGFKSMCKALMCVADLPIRWPRDIWWQLMYNRCKENISGYHAYIKCLFSNQASLI